MSKYKSNEDKKPNSVSKFSRDHREKEFDKSKVDFKAADTDKSPRRIRKKKPKYEESNTENGTQKNFSDSRNPYRKDSKENFSDSKNSSFDQPRKSDKSFYKKDEEKYGQQRKPEKSFYKNDEQKTESRYDLKDPEKDKEKKYPKLFEKSIDPVNERKFNKDKEEKPSGPWKNKKNAWGNQAEGDQRDHDSKDNKNVKHRRSASQRNMDSVCSGEWGKLMLEALKVPEHGRGAYDLTHGFHPYPGRFHPDLPRTILKQFPEESTILDPFMGSGTVMLEGLLWKHKVIGNDLNPIAYMVAQERCRWLSEKNAQRVWDALHQARERVEDSSLEKKSVHRQNITWLKKYYPPHLFVELLYWIDAIDSLKMVKERETLRAVFSSLVIKFSNKLSDTSEFTKTPSFPKGAVGVWMQRKTEELLKRKIELADKISKVEPPVLWNENVLTLETIPEKSADCTLTSPPYPGTYDYFNHDLLRMKWFDFPTQPMSTLEIGSIRNHSPQQWKQVFREFMLMLRKWTKNEGACFLVLGDWVERDQRVSGLEFTQKYADSVGWNVTGSASVEREIFDTELRDIFGRSGKWEHLIMLRQ